MKMSMPKMTILYGSETGTAQDIAEQIWKLSKIYKLKSSVATMDEYEIENFTMENLMVFVVATAGQGDMPLNMKNFWRFLLQKNLPTNFLYGLKYGVLGLGDSSFEKFNFAAKKLNKRLLQLGATELTTIGLADDQHDLGLDAVFGPWTEMLFKNICSLFAIPKEMIGSKNEIIKKFNVSIVNDNDITTSYSGKDIYLYEAQKNKGLIVGNVIENIRTTDPSHFQDVRLIKFKIPVTKYSPGDVLYIKPKNSDEQVEKFFAILESNGVHLNPNEKIKVSEKEIKLPTVLEPIVTLKQLVQQYWDLSYKPKRSTMQVLAKISDNDLEKEKLVEFTAAEGQEEFFNYVNRPRRNILEVLNDFPHTTSKLNVDLLFEVFSPMKPRAFSIASSTNRTNGEVHILVAVVKYKTKLLEPRLGLCSNWLAKLEPDDKAVFWIQKGTFKFHYEKPMILVGPGTGLAPFRSLLFEKASVDKDLSLCILFFGCRYKNKDYHCKEDLEYLNRNYGLRTYCAFSREQEGDRVYVQHVIKSQSELCWQLIQNSAVIYVAGSAKNMPKGVREAFVNLVKEQAQMTEEEAENYIRSLEKLGRYQVETW